uniref:Uncharacterized protein n=1 Tax=Nelumbo nucifera TaxID=4432 RepID=A0A822XNF1_NELNU|nr:TPA_asm: hypothetical protein HUJ06_023035 [Nelumbo nucifera]
MCSLSLSHGPGKGKAYKTMTQLSGFFGINIGDGQKFYLPLKKSHRN